MNDSTRSLLNTLSQVLLRCWILGTLLLVLMLGAILLLGSTIHTLHGSMFSLTAHELDLILYCSMGLLKLAVLSLFFIPWLAIRLTLLKQA
ncbi:DUF6868 family protein [Lignipirellula cremea]|uniref:DUF6868 domain-containing protein n=1 Tax=Lignipirellula cremea TaxID=2528010 RepID=A0A518DN68_9BACT|nr:hypothetical protein [Lignipirellula cremea]QDU93286.1 hypothetical protein Pla8534_10660 [Lignipirellula cremea]